MTKSLLQQVMVRPPVKPVDVVDPDGLVKAIQAGYVASRGTKFQTKKTFAPSTIAYSHGECARYWFLAFNGNDFEDSADAYGVANMTAGTLSHGRIQKAMKDAGILIEDEFKITYVDPPIFGYGDVMLNWQGEELLGEIKTMMSEAFEYRKAAGRPKAGHLIQLLIYMKILKKKKAVFIYENKNNHELLILPVEVNDYYVRWVDQAFDWMRRVRKSWEDQVLPTKNYRSNSKICKTCPVKKACDIAGDGTIKISPLEPLDEKLPMV
jgi:CRISPR/Cas system-associated exonuclease Cas4 (RecB family)